ncbi:hypothetical protein [Ligilactobacillus salivarius]|uniref:Uncharacterized protein n=3 Tax=Ligilactobacillus salivarius TaxID=1624 RepID=A0A1V9SIH0_9LACO|nr:hypothetical protein [Ligilactobacillus salivarius]EGL99330.1 hypothetical protein NIAS840_01048 [Ligilactobacillus salivarius NIAS840]ATP34746.1 hypothetical protein CR249_00035 [Ligilactobacillus salivarius]ATP34808.1 hypothetical protein CR249_00385 [Ligilactobacillus salivarius]MDM8283036.1 hypothetical protein [Ligilactobacillus salivarius]OQQ92004.1 hypothetical protein B6U56_01410 [Ligilactobacillus salivarius]
MEYYNMLRKKDFVKKYKYSPSVYQARMKEFKVSRFSEGYVEVTTHEIWIIEEYFQQFLIWKSKQRN